MLTNSPECGSSEIVPDFKPFRDVSISGGLSTNIFGTLLFKKGFLRGLRHEITPTVGMSYSPSTEKYYEYYDPLPDLQVDEEVRYNPFAPSGGEKLFRSTTLRQGGASMTYNVRNRLRGKTWSKKDSTEKKFEILKRQDKFI